MTALEYLKRFQRWLQTKEGKCYGTVSNSELRRWFQRKSVLINGIKPGPDDEIEFPIRSLVLFPKSGHRCTLWMEDDEWARISHLRTKPSVK